jgi:apolipoprotein N-acyltransferase
MNFLRRREDRGPTDGLRMPAWLVAPVVWTALEYVRTYAFTGLPWGLLGVPQYRSIHLVQVSSITGVYGVSFIVMLVNAAAYECVRRRGVGCLAPLAAAALVLEACLAYGTWWLWRDWPPAGKVRVGIVQGNVPQEEKFGEGFQQEIIQRFHDLTITLKPVKADLIVWPETSVPGYYWYDPVIRGSIAGLLAEMKTPLLLGSNHVYDLENPKYYNSAFFVGADGETVGRYDKMHLVLFGEIVPCKTIFPFLMRVVPFEEDFTPGSEFTVFPFTEGNFAALICFEDIMPDLGRNFVKRGARFLVNVTNDAWFGRTSQPYQQVAHAVFRCVENCVSMVRATNTGLSCFIDPHGRIIGVLRDRSGQELYVQGTAAADIPLARTSTFYTRWGNVFAVCCCIVSVIVYGAVLIRIR